MGEESRCLSFFSILLSSGVWEEKRNSRIGIEVVHGAAALSNVNNIKEKGTRESLHSSEVGVGSHISDF